MKHAYEYDTQEPFSTEGLYLDYPVDFGYLSLSEPRTVRMLILQRDKLDRGLDNEDAMCTYIDLDDLIDECGFARQQSHILRELMKGYGVSDIADDLGIKPQTVNSAIADAVHRIVEKNNSRWQKMAEYRKAKYINEN